MNTEFYVYQYNREDGSPYYIGKGKGKRAWKRCKGDVHPFSDGSNITIVAHKLSDSEALLLEKKLISMFGRIDIGTGILRNKTDGGDGTKGLVKSHSFREFIVQKNKARTGWKHTDEWKKENSIRMLGNQHGVGKLHTDEWKKENASRLIGNTHAKALKGHVQPQVTCPHCNFTGGRSSTKRWHFDNCKFKGETLWLLAHPQF